MSVESGFAENIEFIDENGDSIQNLFGAFSSASFLINESTRPEGTFNNEGKPAEISDGPVTFESSIECKPNSLEILKIMGSFDSQNGTISFPGKLPKHDQLVGQFTDTPERFNFEFFKVGGFTLSAELDGTVLLEFDPILAQQGEIQEKSVDVPAVKQSPLQWTDAQVKIDGLVFGTVESFEVSVDRDLNSEHGLGEGRKPSEITEGGFDISFSFVSKIRSSTTSKDDQYKLLLDDDNRPLNVKDERTPVSEISVQFGIGGEEIVVSNGKAEINSLDFDEDKDTRTVELDFQGTDIEVRNL